MSNVVPASSNSIEAVLMHGDLARLTADQRLSYYKNVCESVGLNPLTRPFEYITLNNKLVLYARKDATDQLRKLHHVSIHKIEKDIVDGLCMVTASARDKDGKEDTDVGSVDITGLKGEKLANAVMKAVTKAKRRVTLSICGLGLLDETEVQDIPEARSVEPSMKEEPLPDASGSAEGDLGEYIIRFGKKYTQDPNGEPKTVRLKELEDQEIQNYLDWMSKNVMVKNSDSIPNSAKELFEIANAYLKSLDDSKKLRERL